MVASSSYPTRSSDRARIVATSHLNNLQDIAAGGVFADQQDVIGAAGLKDSYRMRGIYSLALQEHDGLAMTFRTASLKRFGTRAWGPMPSTSSNLEWLT